MEYDNNNRGAVWPNTRKSSDTHADYTGSITVEGVEYWLNMWKQDEGGKKPAFRFNVSPKEKKKESEVPF